MITPTDNLYDSFDLSKLMHIDANALKAYVTELNNISPEQQKNKKIVVAIGSGGTIAMKVTADNKWVPDLNFEEIMNFSDSHLKQNFLVKGFDAFAIDSSQMDYTHTRDLAICISYICKNIAIPIIGFLVLHGTDTMTYSAAAISLMMGQGLQHSIVYTGAQKPIQEPLNDAVKNLNNALYTLESLSTNNMAEVILVMGDMAILGTSSEKVDESQANAFNAPLHKYVARFNRLDYPVKLSSWLKPKRKQQEFKPVIWDNQFSHTLLVKSHLGLCPQMVARQAADPQIKAIILYSYGGNTVYEPIVNEILPVAQQKHLNIFVVSPVNAELKATYESAHHMIENGVVPLYMTLSTALAKIEIALRMHPKDTKSIAEFMTTNYVGEIPDKSSRYIS